MENLEKIGLTKGESKVYLALLEVGPSTVGPVVKKSGVAYSKVYEILQRLIGKGLVSFIIKGKTRYFQAADPKNLLDYVERQEIEIMKQKKFISSILPKLETMKINKIQQEAEIFVGIRGLKAAYLRLLSETGKRDWLFFYIHNKIYARDSDRFYKNISKFFRNSDIKMRGVCNKEYRYSNLAKTAKFMKMRYVNFPIPGIIDIYGEYVLVISWDSTPVGFLIKSPQFSNSMRIYFESVWNG